MEKIHKKNDHICEKTKECATKKERKNIVSFAEKSFMKQIAEKSHEPFENNHVICFAKIVWGASFRRHGQRYPWFFFNVMITI